MQTKVIDRKWPLARNVKTIIRQFSKLLHFQYSGNFRKKAFTKKLWKNFRAFNFRKWKEERKIKFTLQKLSLGLRFSFTAVSIIFVPFVHRSVSNNVSCRIMVKKSNFFSNTISRLKILILIFSHENFNRKIVWVQCNHDWDFSNCDDNNFPDFGVRRVSSSLPLWLWFSSRIERFSFYYLQTLQRHGKLFYVDLSSLFVLCVKKTEGKLLCMLRNDAKISINNLQYHFD